MNKNPIAAGDSPVDIDQDSGIDSTITLQHGSTEWKGHFAAAAILATKGDDEFFRAMQRAEIDGWALIGGGAQPLIKIVVEKTK